MIVAAIFWCVAWVCVLRMGTNRRMVHKKAACKHLQAAFINGFITKGLLTRQDAFDAFGHFQHFAHAAFAELLHHFL